MSKEWPLPRKGNKYVVVPRYDKKGLPLLIVMRDLLKYGKTKREVKKILNAGKVEINGNVRKDEKLPLFPLDKIKIGESIYEIRIKNKRLSVEPSKEYGEFIRKVKDKKMVKGNKIQVNLLFGENILTKEKVNIGDSLVLDKEKKIVGVLGLGKGAKVLVISGKHIGTKGKIVEIGKDNLVVESNGKINVNKKDAIVIEDGK